MTNSYNFTARIRSVLNEARHEAARLRHEYVSTEHVLLGIIAEREGVAAAVFQSLGVELKVLKLEIERQVENSIAETEGGPDLPYTLRAQKVLELAMSQAREFNHSYVGTEHLLLGLLREENGIAAQTLVAAGVTYDRARGEILRVLGGTETN